MDSSRAPRAVPRRRARMSGVVAVVVTALLAGPLVTVATTPASAAAVDPAVWYVLVNRNSGKALDVSGAATGDGAQVVQWTRHSGQNQQWQFVDSDGGYYRLRARHSGKVLDVHNWSTADGGAIVQFADWGGGNQQWQLVRVDGPSQGGLPSSFSTC